MKTGLLVIDVKTPFAHEDANDVSLSNSGESDNIPSLLAEFRQRNNKVIHIHHHALDDVVQSFVAPLEGEDGVIKQGDSGFVDTSLEQILGDAGIERLLVCSATVNHGVERVTDQMNYLTSRRLQDEFARVFPTSEPLAI